MNRGAGWWAYAHHPAYAKPMREDESHGRMPILQHRTCHVSSMFNANNRLL
jgi:hypothetical protein